MAQRETWSFPPLKQVEMDRVLGRIGLADHDPFRWEALNWFVVFAQRDLGSATEGDWLQLTEEINALLQLVTHQELPTPLSQKDLRYLQDEALKLLTRLVDKHEAEFGPFKVKAFIRRGEGQAAGPSQMKRLGPVTSYPSGPFAGFIGPDGVEGLLYHLLCLLMRFRETVQRCPHCQRLFARFRRHAQYCSRKCQSVVAAREYRSEQAEKKHARITKPKKGAAR